MLIAFLLGDLLQAFNIMGGGQLCCMPPPLSTVSRLLPDHWCGLPVIGVAFLLLSSLESIVDRHLVADLRGTTHFNACLVSFI